jgi:hypothetical protein
MVAAKTWGNWHVPTFSRGRLIAHSAKRAVARFPVVTAGKAQASRPTTRTPASFAARQEVRTSKPWKHRLLWSFEHRYSARFGELLSARLLRLTAERERAEEPSTLGLVTGIPAPFGRLPSRGKTTSAGRPPSPRRDRIPGGDHWERCHLDPDLRPGTHGPGSRGWRLAKTTDNDRGRIARCL